MFFWFYGVSVSQSPPIVWAMCVATGIGKTQITIEELAKWLRIVTVGPIIYAVPRHQLGEEIRKQFITHGIDARIFRGRAAADPENPGKAMCLNLLAVELAMNCHADVTKTCCKSGKMTCHFFDRCGYQRQMSAKGDQPTAWIVASDMLFHSQRALGEAAVVIIDEAIWQKGIRGIEQEQNEWTVSLDSLCSRKPKKYDDLGGRTAYRNLLGEALQKQQSDGGVERQHFTEISADTCREAARLEWKLLPQVELRPGMSAAEITQLARDGNLIDDIRLARRIIKIWETLGEMLSEPDVAVSGRLTLHRRNGQRVVEWRGVEGISKQFQVPTLLLDATLPDAPILQVYHPQAKIAADIQVAMAPPVHIRQIRRAPTSSNKLKDEKHCDAVLRHILQRWMETGRAQTLVIVQQKFEDYLKSAGLPDNIKIAHYNDVAGLDHYKDVRLLILVGRTAPGPQAMETLAGALSGAQPARAKPNTKGFTWYEQTKRGIRLASGGAVETTGDLHPDPFVEAVRRLVHEAELIQAIGRGRGVNRTTETPLDIDLLFDTCLPITVEEVSVWKPPSLLITTAAADGVMLTSFVDMTKLWPQLWPNEKSAYRTLEQGVPVLPEFVPISYRLAGPKMKQRLAYFNLAIIPEPITWLRERLGPLTPL